MTTFTNGPKGILQVDDAHITFKNFSGKADKYNREGDRNFAIKIPDPETAAALAENGWNIKEKIIEDEKTGESKWFGYLPVKVKFTEFGPTVYLNDETEPLTEDLIDLLDKVEIAQADLDIRPYNWEVNGKTGVAAYLNAGRIYQVYDRFSR